MNMLIKYRFLLGFMLIAVVFIFCGGCKTLENDSNLPIQIGGQKEVIIKVNDFENRPKLRETEQSESIGAESRAALTHDSAATVASINSNARSELIKIEKSFDKFQLFIPKANAGIIKDREGALWLYLEETRKFFDAGWYIYDYSTKTVSKAIKTYFDMDLMNELAPKYNKKDYFYFKKSGFDKITLYKFNQPVFTWLYSTFKTEIPDSTIFCITVDENLQEIWFGLSRKIKKFDMRREMWSEPLNERGAGIFDNSEVNEIIVFDDYVWFMTFNCNIIIYDRQRDIWKSWKPSEFSCNYLAFIDNEKNYVWFKSDFGVWQFKKSSNQWTEFDITNRLGSKIIKKVLIDELKNIWIETVDEIGYYNKRDDLWEIISKSNFPLKNRSGINYLNAVYSLAKDGNTIWLSTETGLINYNLATKSW